MKSGVKWKKSMGRWKVLPQEEDWDTSENYAKVFKGIGTRKLHGGYLKLKNEFKSWKRYILITSL